MAPLLTKGFIAAEGVLFMMGAFGPFLGMDLGLAHYLLLAAICVYMFFKFTRWLNRPGYASNQDAIFIKSR